MLRRVNSRVASYSLILANLIPLVGVLWFDWSVLEILLLYWTESVTIGVINVLRMTTNLSDNLAAGFVASEGDLPPDAAAQMKQISGSRMGRFAAKATLIPFFVVHYGIFCIGHVMGVISIFARPGEEAQISIDDVATTTFLIAAAGIFLSHLLSFFVNYLGRGENRSVPLSTLMSRPYGRIFVMHITVIAGAGLAQLIGSPLPVLVVLVVAKTAFDLKLHRRERERFA